MTNSLNRRNFLRGSAVVGASTLAAPAIAGGHGTTLKMQAAWGGGIFLENANSYVQRVNEMSGGSLTIELLPVNSVVKTSQMQDAVHRGVLDAAHYVPAYWYSKSKAASLFGTGPCFGWSSQEVLGWIYYGGGQELFDELMASLGLNVVSFFNSAMPAQPMGWFKEEIKDSSQMKGLKYRTVGLAADVLLEMGMSVVQLPGGEIQPAMKSGLIDAAEFNNPTSDRDFGMQDVSKHYHLGSFHQSQEFFEVTFNKKKFDALADEQKAILKYASEAENSNFYWHNTNRYANDLDTLRNEQGVNVYRTPDSVMADQLKAWDIVVDRISGEDEFFAKVVDSQKAYAKRVMGYLNLNQPDYRRSKISIAVSSIRMPKERALLNWIHSIESLSQWVGKAFGWCILILTLSVSYEVFVRYVLNSPTVWAFDMMVQMYGALFLMAGAYTLAQDAHVRGDVLYRLFSVRWQARVDFLLYIIFFFPGMIALFWYGWEIASDSWRYKEVSWNSPARIQIYFFKTLIPVAGVLLMIQGLAEMARCWIAMKTGKWPERIADVKETEDLLIDGDTN